MNTLKMSVVAVAIWSAVAIGAHADQPDKCSGIDRILTQEQARTLSQPVSYQFHVQQADVLQAFRFRGWSILYIDTHDADEAFVFYRGDPLRTRYVTVWGGAAGYNEEDEIRLWVLENARGIPKRLAACFAWHVTKGRDM